MEIMTESIINKTSEPKIGVRFGFVGVGMGGSSIAAACVEAGRNNKAKNDMNPYAALLVNTNSVDLDKIQVSSSSNVEKLLIGDGKGAGRNIQLGEEIFRENEKKVVDALKATFDEKTDFIWVVAGLGGGTGTGSVIEAIRVLMENGFRGKFGLILTLPRHSEGFKVMDNAISRLMNIANAMNHLGSIILVDNEKLYQHFISSKPTASIADYLSYSNDFIADTLHEMNLVTNSFSVFGGDHFDVREFLNLISTPGLLHFAKYSDVGKNVDSAQFASHLGKLKREIDNGVLSDGYDLKYTKRLAVSIVAKKTTAARIFNVEFTNNIASDLNKMAPTADEKPIAQYTYDGQGDDLYFYAVFAGLRMPSSVKNLVSTYTEIKEKKQTIQLAVEDDVFAGFSAEPDPAPQSIEEDNPFAFLNKKDDSNDGKPKDAFYEAFGIKRN